MDAIASYLAETGYAVVNAGYPSTRYPVRQIAETHIPEVMGQCREKGHKKIHFVTHSMGGIVIRKYLQAHQLPPGSRSFKPICSWIIPGKDDGRVAIESTKLPEMDDFLVLAHTHNFIAASGEVCRQVAAFLETGRFRRSRPASEKDGH